MPQARQRRTRGEGDQLRGELVAAAIDLLLQPQALPTPSLRAIARKSGVAPSAVYMHFDSQDALEYAVTAELFDRLRSTLDAADPVDAAPATRLRALLDAYLDWAENQPGAYQLLFERPDPTDSAGTGPGLDLLDRLAQTLPASARSDAPTRAMQVWCAIHGVASLRIHKPSAPWTRTAGSDAWALVERVAGFADAD
ncbi:TetR/AcrR family transcriptional regulator [Nocardia sp. NBC_00511]|uniref:TetR/AcrR family transcriptional regulator n=1 Tax=Nocardia sp. NBC_00511 TaxID=2903591 RepID=UPI0030E08C34